MLVTLTIWKVLLRVAMQMKSGWGSPESASRGDSIIRLVRQGKKLRPVASASSRLVSSSRQHITRVRTFRQAFIFPSVPGPVFVLCQDVLTTGLSAP